MSGSRVARRGSLFAAAVALRWMFVVLVLWSVVRAAESRSILDGTSRLEWPEADLSARMMDGAHLFVERKIAEAPAKRASFWQRDFSSREAYEKSITPNRDRLRTIIGAVDKRLGPLMERYGDDTAPALVAKTERYRVFQVRWAVLEGVWGAGLLVEPVGAPSANIVWAPDAGQAPEEVLKLEVVHRLAQSSARIIIPVTVSRDRLATEDAQLKRSDQTYREWIYRQAFHLGRHVIGYEAQVVSAAIDWLRSRPGEQPKVGVAGYGEGGLLALHVAAIDPRIEVALVSGYFDAREDAWKEPIYRNVWGRSREFGDAEIAELILPRTLIIEHSAVPNVTGHKGELRQPEFARLQAEVSRVKHSPAWRRPHFIHQNGTPVGPFSPAAVVTFTSALGVSSMAKVYGEPPQVSRTDFDLRARHERFVRELEGHVQLLIRRSDEVREKSFLHAVMPELAESRWSTARRHPTHSPDKFIAGAKKYREAFWEEGMGRFDEVLRPFNPRTRKVAESDGWTAYDVVLDVYPELFAWGLLVVPKDLKPGERRPVVVCQHGRNGVPRDLLDKEESAYNQTAARLAERGFVTFAPHNLYRGEDRYRWLSRKANTIKATLFSFIIAQHDQILRWLETQPFVDAKRIGFYGLSYGGETAVRVPPILEKYALSICSGDFNQWTRKVASTDQPFTFMRTIEWEMPYWNLGHTFDYAEMAYLMIPRPFMAERGHHDRVGRDPWIAYEYAKVRWLYAQLGMADRTEIEFFQGAHSMNQEGAFEFLHRHFQWPKVFP